MSRIGASLLLCFTVALLSTTHAQAEVWRCHHHNGSDFITAGEQNPGACMTFRIPDHPRLYDPNRYFPEFYAIITRARSSFSAEGSPSRTTCSRLWSTCLHQRHSTRCLGSCRS